MPAVASPLLLYRGRERKREVECGIERNRKNNGWTEWWKGRDGGLGKEVRLTVIFTVIYFFFHFGKLRFHS